MELMGFLGNGWYGSFAFLNLLLRNNRYEYTFPIRSTKINYREKVDIRTRVRNKEDQMKNGISEKYNSEKEQFHFRRVSIHRPRSLMHNSSGIV